MTFHYTICLVRTMNTSMFTSIMLNKENITRPL